MKTALTMAFAKLMSILSKFFWWGIWVVLKNVFVYLVSFALYFSIIIFFVRKLESTDWMDVLLVKVCFKTVVENKLNQIY